MLLSGTDCNLQQSLELKATTSFDWAMAHDAVFMWTSLEQLWAQKRNYYLAYLAQTVSGEFDPVS